MEDKQQWSLAGEAENTGNFYYQRTDFDKCAYPMGVDPVWGVSTAKLTFSNNIKMKLSVIMGIVHMTIGVLIKGTNAIFHKDFPTLIFEVIAGLVMLLGLFGWMDLLIFGKWFFPVDFTSRDIVDGEFKGDLANRATPSVINIMITTVFGGGKLPKNVVQYTFLIPGDRTNGATLEMQETMYGISINLLICAMVSLPLMLLVKPICCRPKHKADVEESSIELSDAYQQIPINESQASDDIGLNRQR